MTDGTSERGFFFVRHGQTDANRDGLRSGGECDAHLTELGREQAFEAGLTLHRLGLTPGLILSSPLSRTLETAWLLSARFDLEVRIVSGLIERRLGAWNGRSVEATRLPLAAGETPPGGESDAVFRARVLAAFRALVPLYARWPLIVSSRGVARILMEHAGRESAVTLPNGIILRVTLTGPGNPGDFEVAGIHPVEPRLESAWSHGARFTPAHRGRVR